ncbi:chemotaxis protein CheW [Paludibaculum fermentans]|uniref:chemotaxis protein CheW n=1 Tax=Paludibaculum fermentans TaxID=1473598 RepID=UPI003EB91FDA
MTSACKLTDSTAAIRYATFVVAGHYFGTDVTQVQEVLRHQAMTPVPLAPPVIQGLINLRGQIVTAIEMRQRLGLPERADQEESMNVVVRTEDGVVSLLVDEIGDVVEGEPQLFEAPPESLDPVLRSLVSGIYKLKGRLLLVLDIRQTLNLDAMVGQLAG